MTASTDQCSDTEQKHKQT